MLEPKLSHEDLMKWYLEELSKAWDDYDKNLFVQTTSPKDLDKLADFSNFSNVPITVNIAIDGLKCTCGSKSVGSNKHSSYCEMNNA